MKGIIVGFGTIAMGHLVGYSGLDGLDVVAAVDPSPARRLEAERQFGLRTYPSFSEMLSQENPEFIDVCTPPSSHSEYIRLGLLHGLHVLCEKPVLLPDANGYDDLVAEICASKKIVYPCHNYKFAPILALMQEVVRAPEFGTVLHAKFRTLRNGHAIGVPEWSPHWRRDPTVAAGGILRDHGPHSIYLATHLTGRTPVAVSCLTGNLRRDRYTKTEDTALVVIRCDDGLQIMLDLSWSAGFRNTYYSIVGSNGCVEVENDNVCVATDGCVNRTVLSSNFDDPSHADWFRRMFCDFQDKVASPGDLPHLLQETLMVSLVIDAAYTSAAADGRWVNVAVQAIAPFFDGTAR